MGPELIHESLNAVNNLYKNQTDKMTNVSIHEMSMSPRLSLDLIRLCQQQGYISKKYTAEQLLITYTYAITGLCVNWYIESDYFSFKEEVYRINKLIYGDEAVV